jgi:hypothetical protein
MSALWPKCRHADPKGGPSLCQLPPGVLVCPCLGSQQQGHVAEVLVDSEGQPETVRKDIFRMCEIVEVEEARQPYRLAKDVAVTTTKRLLASPCSAPSPGASLAPGCLPACRWMAWQWRGTRRGCPMPLGTTRAG